MVRLHRFSETKRSEIIRNFDGNALVDFFYQYSMEMDNGQKYTCEENVEIMDTWGEIRTELLRRLSNNPV